MVGAEKYDYKIKKKCKQLNAMIIGFLNILSTASI